MNRLDHPDVVRARKRDRERVLIAELIAAGIIFLTTLVMASAMQQCADSSPPTTKDEP